MKKLTVKEFTDYYDYACSEHVRVKTSGIESLRRGQIFFNCLHELYPEVAAQIRASDIDPFYDDSKIKVFLQSLVPKIENNGSTIQC